MALRKPKEKILEITGEITFADIKSAIDYLEKNNVRPRGETLYFIKDGKNIGYSFNQIIITINNVIRKNKIHLTTDDVVTWEVGQIFEEIKMPDNYIPITPWNDNGKKLIITNRNIIIDYAKNLGYEINNDSVNYTTLKYLDNDFAKIYYPDDNSKIRADILFDELCQPFKHFGNRLKKNDETQDLLDGIYMITLEDKTINQIKEILKYSYEHGNEILNKLKDTSKGKGVLDAMVLAMYKDDNTGTTQYPPSKISELDKIEGAVSTHRYYLQKHCEKCDEADNSGTFPTYFIHHGPKGGGTYSLSKSGLERAKEITEEISETLKGADMSEQPLNQILYGPPGTGKTYNTVVKAMSIINKQEYDNVSDEQYKILKKEFDKLVGSQIEFVTFHQSYSYEEFVEGIKPYIPKSVWDAQNIDDIEKLEVKYIGKKGIFREICKRAETDLENNYVLIIDEINRGNISKIFGELITLIEEDKRGKFKVRLPYSQDEFTVPENLYIIGTMNTSDRSIASVDIALRRRFTFKEMMPDPKLVADFGLKDTKLEVGFKDIYKILNKKITILADRDHQIGHSYFIKDKHEGENINDLKNIWFDSVMPLLNEYFYGDWEKLQQILGKAEEEDDKKEEAEKEEDKYTSFIKKISFKDLNLDTSCFDENCDCFDFVEDNKINFEGALKKAFYPEGDKKTDKKNSTGKPESEVVEEDTEE